jgi:ABC-2 type transport system permease protein
LGISFLTGNIVKSRNAISAVANVLSLGTCFISGVFVPRDFLGDTLLKFASLTPTYWYVKSNHIIGSMERLKEEDVRAILTSFIVMLVFAVTAFAVSMVLKKQKYMRQVRGF